MPPTHFDGGNVNMFQPYVVGQSGTDSPEPVLVTEAAGEHQEDRAAGDELGEPVEHLGSGRRSGECEAGRSGRPTAAGPPVLPEFSRRVVGRRRLEREGDFLRFLRAERDALRHRAELLVPRFDRVGAGRQRLQLELAVLAGRRRSTGDRARRRRRSSSRARRT